MESGAYIINVDPGNELNIQFAIKPGVKEVPELQRSLHLEVEKTLIILRKLFENDRTNFEIYFNQLLSLAQAGLVPDNAQPLISIKALEQLKFDVIHKTSGEIKNTYFKNLGLQAFSLAKWPIIVIVLIKILYYYFPISGELKNLDIISNFLIIWSGCMLGVWLSFGARKTVLTFEELTTIEEDRLEPMMRLLFAGAITMVFAILFYKKGIEVTIGVISSTEIKTDMFTAIIFGVFLGLSEQVLGKKITRKAATAFEKN